MTLSALPTTLAELRASGWEPRTVKQEIRQNLLARLRGGEPAFPAIVGFDDTVLPELETALLAGHDLVLLGERGQGKTRLMRTLGGLLDEWSPAIEGCEVNDDPLHPVCGRCRQLAEELGEAMPVHWRHRSERYTQIRGYSLRLPLDLLLVATANPEDYTNRGRIITPLKDRFGAEIRTHYQLEV